MSRILVLGPEGQLGRALVHAAPARGFDVLERGRDRLDLSRLDTLAPALAELEFDILVNCAAVHGTDRIEDEPGDAFRVNGRAPGVLAAHCRDRGAALVQVSSDYVFDGEAGRPYRVEDAPRPINVYGASKLMGESLARREHPEGARVVRTASLYGEPAPGHGSGSFVGTVLAAAAEGRRLRVVDDVVMSPTWAVDAAGAILDLLEAGAPPGCYHAVNAGEASWFELARAVLEGPGVASPDEVVEAVSSQEYGATAARPRYSVLDATQANAYSAPRHWREALDAYLAARPAAE